MFGYQKYKDSETQTIVCPKCNNTISQKEVMNVLTAMRFITDLLDKQELEQMGPKLAQKYVLDLKKRFEPYLTEYNVYYCKLIEVSY